MPSSTNQQAGSVPEAEAANALQGRQFIQQRCRPPACCIDEQRTSVAASGFTSMIVNRCRKDGHPVAQARLGDARFVRRATHEIRKRGSRETTRWKYKW